MMLRPSGPDMSLLAPAQLGPVLHPAKPPVIALICLLVLMSMTSTDLLFRSVKYIRPRALSTALMSNEKLVPAVTLFTGISALSPVELLPPLPPPQPARISETIVAAPTVQSLFMSFLLFCDLRLDGCATAPRSRGPRTDNRSIIDAATRKSRQRTDRFSSASRQRSGIARRFGRRIRRRARRRRENCRPLVAGLDLVVLDDLRPARDFAAHEGVELASWGAADVNALRLQFLLDGRRVDRLGEFVVDTRGERRRHVARRVHAPPRVSLEARHALVRNRRGTGERRIGFGRSHRNGAKPPRVDMRLHEE